LEISLKFKEIPEKVKNFLVNALISAKQLLSQVNDFIDLSSILSQNFKIIKQNFNLRE
jgi:hypothetical protein